MSGFVQRERGRQRNFKNNHSNKYPERIKDHDDLNPNKKDKRLLVPTILLRPEKVLPEKLSMGVTK